MVSDRCYRKACSYPEAFAELRRCSGTQFDPRLVERFIAAVETHERRQSHKGLQISKQAALRIGVQMENFAAALDAQDRESLAAMVGQLDATARESGTSVISGKATALQRSMAAGADWPMLATEALDLMDLCRATYDSYLPSHGSNPVRPW